MMHIDALGVQSPHLMDWIEPESFGLCCPDAADVFIRREASQGLEAAGEIVCRDEIADVSAELIVAVVVIAFDGCLLDRPVHPFDLAICPGMPGLGQSMLYTVSPACPVEWMAAEPGCWSVAVLGDVGELDAVVGQHRVYFVRNSGNQCFQEVRRRPGGGTLDEVDKGELGGPIYRDIEVEFAFGGLHLSQIDVKIADCVGLELLSRRLVAIHLRQSRNSMALQTSMQ